MNSYNRDLIAKEKALHHRYMNDCRAIEDRQDAVRKQKRDVDELNRNMYERNR